MRTNEEIIDLYNRQIDRVYQICFMFLKNKEDAEDATQDIFVKVIQKNIEFENLEHEKAWFIVATRNHCKNILSHWSRRNIELDEQLYEHQEITKNELLQQVLELPQKYKLPIYMYYYEGYKSEEIAKILKLNHSTLRSRLKNGRQLLKLAIEGENHE